MVESFRSEDFKEGVAHFVEKRAPALSADSGGSDYAV